MIIVGRQRIAVLLTPAACYQCSILVRTEGLKGDKGSHRGSGSDGALCDR